MISYFYDDTSYDHKFYDDTFYIDTFYDEVYEHQLMFYWNLRWEFFLKIFIFKKKIHL